MISVLDAGRHDSSPTTLVVSTHSLPHNASSIIHLLDSVVALLDLLLLILILLLVLLRLLIPLVLLWLSLILLSLLILILLLLLILVCIFWLAIGDLISLLLHAIWLLARCLLGLLAFLVGVRVPAKFFIPFDELVQALVIHLVVHFLFFKFIYFSD